MELTERSRRRLAGVRRPDPGGHTPGGVIGLPGGSADGVAAVRGVDAALLCDARSESSKCSVSRGVLHSDKTAAAPSHRSIVSAIGLSGQSLAREAPLEGAPRPSISSPKSKFRNLQDCLQLCQL
jgi:hypothetical protein